MSLKLGVNPGISNVEYHSDNTFLSSSDLKLILKDPAQFYKEKILKQKEVSEKSFFDEGSYVHSLILEPHLVKEQYAFFDGMRKAGAEFERFKNDNKGKVILSKAQQLRCKAYYEAYLKRPEAKHLIKGGESEHTVCVNMHGVDVKVRTDYVNVEAGYIVDVKTSGFPIDLDSFKMTVSQFQYGLSAALYADVLSQHYGKPFDFYFLVLGKKDLTCQVYKVSSDTMALGQAKVLQALQKYVKCKKENDWTGVNKPAKIGKVSDYIIEEI